MQVHIVFEYHYTGAVAPVAVYLNRDDAVLDAKHRWDAYVETMEVEDADD